jgi:DNA-binding response OmpR family regulator
MAERKTVLVAEEAKTTRKMLSFLLANRGYEVIEATNGREALDKAKTLAPDLVILSAELSELSGYDLYSILKARRASAHMPILLLVAFSNTLRAPTRTLPDPEFLLSKPFSAHEFLQRVRTVLSESSDSVRP